MERYELVISEDVQKQIRSIPLPWRTRIGRTLELLEDNPFLGEKIKGEFEGKRKVKVWPYRIFYRIYKQEKVILIVEVQHREGTRYK